MKNLLEFDIVLSFYHSDVIGVIFRIVIFMLNIFFEQIQSSPKCFSS